jgi:hypothetical protein
MFMQGLGRIFDLSTAVVPVDLNTADAATGKRISMANASGLTIILHTLAGGADDLVIDVQQHTAYVNGTSADLDSTAVASSTGITQFHIKAETALDGDEAWVKVSQAEASECTVVGATYGAMQKLVAVYVSAAQLGDGYSHLSANLACTTSTSQLVTVLYLLHDLAVQRNPVNMANALRPGAANV